MTRHLGRLTSFPLSAYIGPAGREMRGRAVHKKVVYFGGCMEQYSLEDAIYNCTTILKIVQRTDTVEKCRM